MLCELCGPENDCTCGGCQCKWCRDRRGDYVSPFERAQIDRHVRSLLVEEMGQKLRDYQGPRH